MSFRSPGKQSSLHNSSINSQSSGDQVSGITGRCVLLRYHDKDGREWETKRDSRRKAYFVKYVQGKSIFFHYLILLASVNGQGGQPIDDRKQVTTG